MGYIRVRARIWNIEKPTEIKEVELLVNTGAIYTVLPSTLLRSMGVKPVGRRRFRLADNRVVEREVGIIGIEVEGVKTHTPVVFGDENVYLLGTVTLEELGLEVDPVTRKLKPAELLLM